MDGSESAIPLMLAPRKIAVIETSPRDNSFMLIVAGLRDREALEALDILRARGHVDT